MVMLSWEYTEIECCKCKCKFVLPQALYTAANASDAISFYCPYGHGQHFKSPRTLAEEERVRQERDRLKQQLAQKDDELAEQRRAKEAAQRSANAQKGQVTRLKNRAKAGLCPCCNRHFANLERHIAGQHPEFTKEKEAEATP